MKTFEVGIDYPSEFVVVEANNEEEAMDKALEMLGEVTIIPEKQCTAFIVEN